MNIDNRIVPFINRITPLIDESLPSLYLRVAMENYYPTVNVVAQVIKEVIAHTFYTTKSIAWNPTPTLNYSSVYTPRFFNRISPLFGISETRLRTTWLPNFAIEDVLIPPNVQFCLECVVEQQYHRKQWLSLFVVACTRHRCLLITHCPQCNIALNIISIWTIKCHSCKYDLRAAPVISMDSLDWVVHAHQRIESWMLETVYTHPDSIPLFDTQPIPLQYHVFHWLQHLVRVAVPYWEYVHRFSATTDPFPKWPLLKKCSIEQRYALTTTAMKGIAHWPESFTEFLTQFHSAPLLYDHSDHSNKIKSSWPFSDKDYRFVWNAFTPMLAEEFYPLQNCLYSDEIAFEYPFAYISIEKVASLFDTLVEVVAHFVYLGLLTAVVRRHKYEWYIKMADVRQFQRQWGVPLSCAEVAEWLDCSPEMVVALAERGLLVISTPTIEHEKLLPWNITRASVVAILTDLARHEVEWNQGPRPRLIPLVDAVPLLSEMNIDVIGIIKLVIEGQLPYYRQRRSPFGHIWYRTSRKVPLGIDAIDLDRDDLEQ